MLARSERQEQDDVLEGALECTARECRREHPIIDGVPIIVPDVSRYIGHQLAEILAREDLAPFTESLIGDAAGPASDHHYARSQLSSYARGHYGDLDPECPARADGSLARLVGTIVDAMDRPPAGVWLDVGCGPGRATLELAARTGELALGVDLRFAFVRMARRVARTGVARYPLRRVGLVFDPREHPVDLPGRERVDYWACEALALPLAEASVDGATSLNLLDCVSTPVQHLVELGRVLRPGSPAALATPFDWNPSATALEGWLGGHSQRGPDAGSSVAELRRVLGDPASTGVPTGLTIDRELPDQPWNVYLHERAEMHHRLYTLLLRRV